MRYRLILLVGPSAVGKTFWMERLVRQYQGKLQRIKTTTTRPRRDNDPSEEHSYHFVTEEEFEQMVREGKFLEHTVYLGNHYGSTFQEIQQVLSESHGIFALTADGVRAWWEHRNRIPMYVFALAAVSEQVVRANLERRGILNPVAQQRYIAKAHEFQLPGSIEFSRIPLTGNEKYDEPKILECIVPLIGPSV